MAIITFSPLIQRLTGLLGSLLMGASEGGDMARAAGANRGHSGDYLNAHEDPSREVGKFWDTYYKNWLGLLRSHQSSKTPGYLNTWANYAKKNGLNMRKLKQNKKPASLK